MLINQDVSHFPNFQAAILGAVEFFSVDLQKELGQGWTASNPRLLQDTQKEDECLLPFVVRRGMH